MLRSRARIEKQAWTRRQEIAAHARLRTVIGQERAWTREKLNSARASLPTQRRQQCQHLEKHAVELGRARNEEAVARRLGETDRRYVWIRALAAPGYTMLSARERLLFLGDADDALKIINVLQGTHYLFGMHRAPVQKKLAQGLLKRIEISNADPTPIHSMRSDRMVKWCQPVSPSRIADLEIAILVSFLACLWHEPVPQRMGAMGDTRFIFDSEQQKTLLELQNFYKLDSMSAVLAKAISLLELASDVEANGGELVIKSHGRETKVDLS